MFYMENIWGHWYSCVGYIRQQLGGAPLGGLWPRWLGLTALLGGPGCWEGLPRRLCSGMGVSEVCWVAHLPDQTATTHQLSSLPLSPSLLVRYISTFHQLFLTVP